VFVISNSIGSVDILPPALGLTLAQFRLHDGCTVSRVVGQFNCSRRMGWKTSHPGHIQTMNGIKPIIDSLALPITLDDPAGETVAAQRIDEFVEFNPNIDP